MALTLFTPTWYTFLIRGDILPSVVTVQMLLRRHQPQAVINADGIFGQSTRDALKKFQDFHGLKVDGIVGAETWNKLMDVSGFQTLDLVDGTDPSLVQLEAHDTADAGDKPIVVYGQSNGIQTATNLIVAQGDADNIALLRFHGHGNKGIQNVTGGTINGSRDLAAISNSNFDRIRNIIAPIAGIMVPFGSVQMLGCNVGGGPEGASLVSKLAVTWGVPVTAGINTQFGGGTATFRFEGPTVTGFPNGGSLISWGRGVQATSGNVSMPT